MRFLYTLLTTLALPVIIFRLWWRGRRLPAYRQRWRERLGFAPIARGQNPLVWVHAVSVGETIAAAPLVQWLLDRDDVEVLVTTMTPTGSQQVERSFGNTVLHTYMPYDVPGMVRRFLARTKPSLALIIETELWPNTLRECRRRRIPVLLLNARLSEKSAQGYATFPGFTEATLLDLTHVAAQTQLDKERFIELGLPADNCTVTGSVKFDLSLTEEIAAAAAQLKQRWQGAGGRPIVIAASTHPGEEEQLLRAFERILQRHPQALLVIVPRHPDRFEQVAAMVAAAGRPWCRRSAGKDPSAEICIVLGDTLGELLLLYGVADVAFVGGSLVPTGGHNLIEPAAWGVPLITGPHLFNFAEAARLMLANNALSIVEDEEALADEVVRLLAEPEAQRRRGAAAKAVADSNRGATARVQELVKAYLPDGHKKRQR